MTNTVEKTIVPANADAVVEFNDQYELFLPVARTGVPGIATFEPAQFNIRNGVVSLNISLSSGYVNKIDVEEPIPKETTWNGVDKYKSPYTLYFNVSDVKVLKTEKGSAGKPVYLSNLSGTIFATESEPIEDDVRSVVVEYFIPNSANGNVYYRSYTRSISANTNIDIDVDFVPMIDAEALKFDIQKLYDNKLDIISTENRGCPRVYIQDGLSQPAGASYIEATYTPRQRAIARYDTGGRLSAATSDSAYSDMQEKYVLPVVISDKRYIKRDSSGNASVDGDFTVGGNLIINGDINQVDTDVTVTDSSFTITNGAYLNPNDPNPSWRSTGYVMILSENTNEDGYEAAAFLYNKKHKKFYATLGRYDKDTNVFSFDSSNIFLPSAHIKTEDDLNKLLYMNSDYRIVPSGLSVDDVRWVSENVQGIKDIASSVETIRQIQLQYTGGKTYG